jgi:dTDP-D-glucose 4,6-dehydratase
VSFPSLINPHSNASAATTVRYAHSIHTRNITNPSLPNTPSPPPTTFQAGAEFLAKSYHRSFNMPVVITRGNNVYGPHQYPEKLIPKFINQVGFLFCWGFLFLAQACVLVRG